MVDQAEDDAYNALLDAFNEAVFHDQNEPKSLPGHIGEILRQREFEVDDHDIIVDDALQHVSAWMYIEDQWKKIVT